MLLLLCMLLLKLLVWSLLVGLLPPGCQLVDIVCRRRTGCRALMLAARCRHRGWHEVRVRLRSQMRVALHVLVVVVLPARVTGVLLGP